MGMPMTSAQSCFTLHGILPRMQLPVLPRTACICTTLEPFPSEFIYFSNASNCKEANADQMIIFKSVTRDEI